MESILSTAIENIKAGKIAVNSPITQGNQRAIHIAASTGDIEVINQLIELGADLNKKNAFGDSAIHVALNADFIDVVKILLQARADVSSVDGDNKSVVTKIFETGDEDLIKFFASHCQVNAIEIDFKEPMMNIVRGRPIEDGIDEFEIDVSPLKVAKTRGQDITSY